MLSGDDGVDHLVIDGADGIGDVQQLRSFLSDCLSHALTTTSWSERRKAQDKARAQRRLTTETNVLLGGSKKLTRRVST